MAAGVGRVNVAEVAWGTRTDVDREGDSSARGVDYGSGKPEAVSQDGSHQPKEVGKPAGEHQPGEVGKPLKRQGRRG